jgi:hypothetical protein
MEFFLKEATKIFGEGKIPEAIKALMNKTEK